jgi:hypothetical protein
MNQAAIFGFSVAADLPGGGHYFPKGKLFLQVIKIFRV